MFFVAFFLTTPEYLVSQTDIVIQWFTDRANGTVVPDLIPAPIIDFLPTILLWSFTALLPLLVAYSDRWLGHYTRSEVSLNYVFFFFIYFIFLLLEEKMEHFRGSSRLYYITCFSIYIFNTGLRVTFTRIVFQKNVGDCQVERNFV